MLPCSISQTSQHLHPLIHPQIHLTKQNLCSAYIHGQATRPLLCENTVLVSLRPLMQDVPCRSTKSHTSNQTHPLTYPQAENSSQTCLVIEEISRQDQEWGHCHLNIL